MHYFGKISYHDLYHMPLDKQENQYRLLNSQLLAERQEQERIKQQTAKPKGRRR